MNGAVDVAECFSECMTAVVALEVDSPAPALHQRIQVRDAELLRAFPALEQGGSVLDIG